MEYNPPAVPKDNEGGSKWEEENRDVPEREILSSSKKKKC